jgi:phosphoesterase RecJ-like protein
MTETVKNAAPKILEIIKASNNVLLHCHPSPDPDSVGSALAMKFALEQLAKKVTVIRGDSVIPEAFMHFPGATTITPKNFFEVNLAEFDLFIVHDSTIDRVSKIKPVIIPDSLKTIIIDHHVSNVGIARSCDIVDPVYPATALILFDLFKEWKITITPDIAADLFIGSYTDTGGFKFENTKPETYTAAAELVKIYPHFSELIFKMENATAPQELMALGLTLSHIETFMDGHVALSCVSFADLQAKGISEEDVSTRWTTNLLKSVVGWDVCASLVEVKVGTIKVSFSTRDSNKYDLSVISTKVGGGGHKAAAGATIAGTLDEAQQKIIAAIGEYVKMSK